MTIRASFVVACLCSLTPFGLAQKKPLDHSVYDFWKTIRGTSLSHDGKWILYTIAPQEGDAKVEVKSVTTDKTYIIERGSSVSFSNDSKFVVATVVPRSADVKKATKDKVPAADMPKNALWILNLTTGDIAKIAAVTSFQLPTEDSGWFTYRPEPPKPEPKPATATPTSPAPSSARGARRSGAAGTATATTSTPTGTPIVLRNLATGKELRVENVGDAVISKDGSILAYTITSKEGKEDGVYWFDILKGVKKSVFSGKAKSSKLVLNDETKRIAYLCDPSAEPTTATTETKNAGAPAATQKSADSKPVKADPPKVVNLSVFVYDPKTEKTTRLASKDAATIPKGWAISENGALSFSEKGTRLFFGTAPKPAEEKKDDTPDADKVSVDIWNWKDARIMPQQLLQASADQKRTYQAMAVISSGEVSQLETEAIPNVTVSLKGEGEWAIGTSDVNYRLEASWDSDYIDAYLLNLKTHSKQKVLQKSEGRIAFSAEAKYLTGYDPKIRQYFVVDPVSLKRTDFKIPTALFNELEDTPSTPAPYGEAGWTKGDARLLVYDAYDIWSIDPTGKIGPQNLTAGTGRNYQLRFRYMSLDPEAKSIDTSKPLLINAFNEETKAAGFYNLDLNASHPRPIKIFMANKVFSIPLKAKYADVISYTQQDFVEFPDVWVAKSDFSAAKKLSNANPQQAQYNWGTTELVSWTSADGQKLQGILIKPENFTYGKKYPMITYFYERNSDTINAYRSPAPSASTVNLTYFASNGYVMFVPDIPYKTGYPGPSSLSAIVSGVLSIVDRGYVDPKRLGIQGQSWGGYEVAYLITQTNLFNCACSGAAVADMFSAYGGIRYGTGVLREGQYEHGQSRIGGNIWDKPLRYIENSPLFWLDKVETPLLMMHNDKDGAVPFTQGIELFSGLRRLGKPAWMVTYNGEDHNLVERKNRKDWSIRLSQYFDHFLMGAPMPVWMSKGIPATQKGKTYGFELDPKAGK